VTGLIAANITRRLPDLAANSVLACNAGLAVHNFAWAVVVSNLCSYPSARSPLAADSSVVDPELAGVDAGAMWWVCAAWAMPNAPNAEALVASTVPALFVVEPLDAINPQQPELIAGFPNADVLRLPSAVGALAQGNLPCLDELRRTFLANPTRHLDTTDCATQSPPINFATGPS
jgi:hypothetical protein